MASKSKVGTIYLIGKSWDRDEYGIERPTETQRKLRCRVNSIYGYESSNAKLNNIKAEMRIDVRTFEYRGEERLIYKNEKYVVYRKFDRDDDYTELYLQKDAGA